MTDEGIDSTFNEPSIINVITDKQKQNRSSGELVRESDPNFKMHRDSDPHFDYLTKY